MDPRCTITSPTEVLVCDYEPGLLIDCTEPPPMTDLDESRKRLRNKISKEHVSLREAMNAVDRFAVALGLTSAFEEGTWEGLARVARNAQEYFSTSSPHWAARWRRDHESDVIADVYVQLTGKRKREGTPRDQLLSILERAGVLSRPPHHPTRVYSHVPGGKTELAEGTHFGFVLEGEGEARLSSRRRYPLYPHTSFSLPGAAEITGEAKVQIATRKDVCGLLSIGGELEGEGRFQYIDGCADTCLIQPPKRGDPCLNALYIPPGVDQTIHTHPSLRAGVIVEGEGRCETPSGIFPLRQGTTFVLPPETCHSFHTPEDCVEATRAALKIVVFHPDSDTGPTDEDHAMINRTHYNLEHRLRSLLRLSKGGG